MFICEKCGFNTDIRWGFKKGFCFCQMCYKRHRQLLAPKIKCQCKPECKEMIPSITIDGRPQIYKRGHQNSLRSREKHYRYKNGRRKIGKYMSILRPHHPFADEKGYIQEHRYRMELQIGRYLTRKEVIHHIDGNTKNNEESNLMLFASHGEHLAYERTKDWSGICCVKCGNDKTYMRTLKNGKQSPIWYARENGYICSVCRDEERYDKIRKNVWRKKECPVLP